MATSAALFVLLLAVSAYDAWDAGRQREAYNAVQSLKKRGAKPGEELQAESAKWEERYKIMKPDAAALKKNHEMNRGGFVKTVKARAEMTGYFHHTPIYSPMLWDMLVLMLAGMALLKLGVLTGARTAAFYARMAAAGLLVGLPMHAWQLHVMTSAWFDVVASAWAGLLYQVARTAMTLAYVGIAMLLLRTDWVAAPARVLAAVGQMALTNYVMQSVVCTVIFNMLGWHGRMQRYEVYFVVAGIWALELAWSPLWLRAFRFGPMEWAWRSLTYWRRQPFRLRQEREEPELRAPDVPPAAQQA